MTTTPTFKVPAAPGPNTSPLIEVDKALESMRDSGFDFFAAAGEPIDNSVEANATLIRIEPNKNLTLLNSIAFLLGDLLDLALNLTRKIHELDRPDLARGCNRRL
jgi:hypothetical protein